MNELKIFICRMICVCPTITEEILAGGEVSPFATAEGPSHYRALKSEKKNWGLKTIFVLVFLSSLSS